MSVKENSGQQPNRQEESVKKQNNPFSEQEKHGDEAQRRRPGSEREYQGNPSVQRRAPRAEGDIGEDDDRQDHESEVA
jgi:hypothetical protein